MKMYYDADADLGVLQGKKVAIIGFGSQGHAQALNLRDSGVDVVVSEMPETANYELAVKYGFKPVSAAEAAAQAQVVQILTQDHVQARL
ncbi:MAG TPA: NAD(P)-binding domain-containing protein, partial [Desulfobaccales bacterium]|nr:NAD(P)-binding domain-containing protein [Desulfobaccales bacterium]